MKAVLALAVLLPNGIAREMIEQKNSSNRKRDGRVPLGSTRLRALELCIASWRVGMGTT